MIVIRGVAVGVFAAIIAGLIAIVVVGGDAYYLLTKDSLDEGNTITDLPILA